MKKTLAKRVLSTLLVCIMLATMLPVTAFAEDVTDTTTGDEIYDNTNGELDDGTEGGEIEGGEEEGDTELDLNSAPAVTTAQELEDALLTGAPAIRIAADFEIDRTFYITADVVIFTFETHTLTRATTFGGDMFVVGEHADGTVCEKSACLTVGNPESETKDLLIIDGNRDNMTADVVGSVFFVLGNCSAELYGNLTVKNAKKVGNEKTLTGNYGVSYVGRVGGAVAIVADGGEMNIYGGTYTNNAVNDFVDESTEEGQVSTHGGAFYNYGTMRIYGGTFSNNHAARGGALYNYRTMRIYNATISGNTASSYGGAIYMPKSTSAYLYLGGENAVVDSKVVFDGNVSDVGAGAIHARNVLSVENTVFSNNQAMGGNGGAITGGLMIMSIESSSFDNNIASGNGGAIYYSESNGKEGVADLTAANTQFTNNEAASDGGAVYVATEAQACFSECVFEGNASNDGAAFYSTNAKSDFDSVDFIDNASVATGGAVAIYTSSTSVMNAVTATNNTSKLGGFLYTKNSELKIYDSLIQQNSSTSNGGGIALYDNAVTSVYNTTFDGNESGTNADGNGGALFAYTGGTNTVVHSCTFKNNSGDYGGAVYASNKSLMDMYNNKATGNSANKGGFLYQTTTGTTINLVGITLSGNTAITGGPIIWGNSTGAVLNIDKAQYVDRDYVGDWDDAYWSAAIYNLLKVKEIVGEIPDYIGYDGTVVEPDIPAIPVDVITAGQLERALEVGNKLIRIAADFELDRTFYVTRDATIYSVSAHTLTRAADFGGDLFVVGESTAGEACDQAVTLTLGDPESTKTGMLTIDGNRDNMTVDVTGSVLFVIQNCTADLYGDIVIKNAEKVGNEKTLTGNYGVSYVNRVGGAVAILAVKSTMNIYGGTYTNNRTNDIVDDTIEEGQASSYGGAFYVFGVLNVYGGTFSYNHAGRGGAFYAYRTINIYNADIRNNTSSTAGGAIYMPNSTAAYVYLGAANDVVESKVTFADNSAASYGGAIYARNVLSVENTTFSGNSVTASSSYGGAISSGIITNASMKLTVDNSVFTGNTSARHGGAIYHTGLSAKGEYEIVVRNTLFEENVAKANGGVMYVSGGGRVMSFNTRYNQNSAAAGGVFYMSGSHLNINGGSCTSNTTTGNGGAVMLYSSSSAIINNVTADGNAGSQGGFLYSTGSELKLYNSRILNNTTTSNGGGIALYDGTTGGIYATVIEGNTSTANGGGVFAYTNEGEFLLHSCVINNNTGAYGGALYASNKSLLNIYNVTAKDNDSTKGGFMYITTTGTVVTLVGATISGNTAAEGGPIIWGNSTGAKLYIDKAKFADLDHTGVLDAAYWAAAIVNKLKVYDYTGEIPKWLDYGEESYEHMADATDVSSAAQLETALLAGDKYIRVIANFEIDRTFYITHDTTIFSTLPRTLTRAADFAGDVFVVGENADGISAMLLGSGAKLTLGNPLSVQENLLTIDGNKENMTVPVTGTVLFVSNSAIVDLHHNVSIINAKKVDNDRTYLEKYRLSRSNRIGGAMSIIALGTLNIYGGNYRDCEVNEEDASSEETRNCTVGGLLYNNSNLFIYGGNFTNNVGARGAIVYNYRVMKIYGGNFIGNHATVIGGVMYSPNTGGAQVYIGTSTAGTSTVLFENNTAANNAGVVYSSALCSLVIYGNTSFVGNQSGNHGGAICCYGQLTVQDTVFSGNVAKNHGGAAYVANSSDTYDTRYVHIENSTFENNQARYGGALSFYASDDEFPNGSIGTIVNCDFTANRAESIASNTSTSYGGAIYVERRSTLDISDSAFSQNVARSEGGAFYIAGESDVDIADTTFTENSTLESVGTNNGGAISIHSAKLNLTNADFSKNAAVNGAALYVSYTSARDVNSQVTVTDSSFTDNVSRGYGGAIYATRHDVTAEKRVLTVRTTEFARNTALGGGAVNLTAGVQAYFKDVIFTENTSTESYGGAIYMPNGNLEIDKASFSNNSSAAAGGAIYMTGGSVAVCNDITATSNAATTAGGFLYGSNTQLKLYNSTVQNNTAQSNGGGIALYQGAVSNIYNTTFDTNTSVGNGGGLFLYTDAAETLLHTCTFTNNVGVYGGAIYASNASVATMYNITATDNASDKGGFLYETTTGTTITMSGITVSGNTASVGGPIIWGNSKGAVLNINTTTFTDLDVSGELTGDYWASAIVNKLTVNEVTTAVPSYKDYVGEKEPTPGTTTQKQPVSVNDVFSLGISSSDEDINDTYNKFPRLDNSSNFMSKNATTFDNINGGTVTVDTFVYPAKGTADNCSVGQGLLIYQAMLYKQAHPEEEVYIDISSYRFSVQAAVNINRNSRYFGYMRQLSGTANYDKYGFVRIAYLLISAAKMGIHVTAIGHIDAYPTSANTLTLNKYFTSQLSDPCDPDYVADGVIGDYLNFKKVHWSLSEKGGVDMMHTKLCAVSHYLDMNGVEHRNAVWTSSSNLDGITSKGVNANWMMQTATIVSDHADIYRVSVNYLRLMTNYCEQEQVYDFQALMRTVNTEQAALISAGRENEIADDEQLLYLGSETDEVFEMYFTPYGGSTLAWDELTNPHCKYLRKLYDSEDYITFSWNAAEYSGSFAYGKLIEEMLIAAFHKNRDPRNVVFGNMENFDASAFDDLVVGVDIRSKSFNEYPFGQVHNKDLQFSYVEDGERYYVSLFNSMNFHSGSMYYQSNFALVIKEKTCSTDSVFSTLAKYSVKGDMVQHAFGEEEYTCLPEDTSQDGYKYVQCVDCGHKKVLSTVHRSSEWIVDKEPTVTEMGVQHKECLVCHALLEACESAYNAEQPITLQDVAGITFDGDASSLPSFSLESAPHTIEATIRLPKKTTGRGGIIVGNYAADTNAQVNLEIYTGGRVRLFFVNAGKKTDCLFDTDVRSDSPKHIAVTVSDVTATLYVDGLAVETKVLNGTYPNATDRFKVGGDNRADGIPFFKGTIYSINMFGDVRTAAEIIRDRIVVSEDADGLIYSETYTGNNAIQVVPTINIGKTFSQTEAVSIGTVDSAIHTVEAVVDLPKDASGDAGVIIGNGGAVSDAQMNLEIVENGAVRLHAVNGSKVIEHTFATDVRSDGPVHIAITLDDATATLYVNAVAVETASLGNVIPAVKDSLMIGGDNRDGNTAYFKGTIYSVNLFADVRTAEEIKQDLLWVCHDAEELLYSSRFVSQQRNEDIVGKAFSATDAFAVENALSDVPCTIEAMVQLPKTMNDRAGVIVGNYDGGRGPQISLEVYTGGKIRLFYVNGTQRVNCQFNTDIRSDTKRHLAVTVDGLVATLYIDGALAERVDLSVALPKAVDGYMIGGDHRTGNICYFRGLIYSVHMFSDVRTAQEIARDANGVGTDADCLLYSKVFTSEEKDDIKTMDSTFGATETFDIPHSLADTPRTFEAVIQLSPSVSDRGGVIVGNYIGGDDVQLNLEVYTQGRLRLFYVTGKYRISCLFKTDVRSAEPKHIAVTVNGRIASLYVDGQLAEKLVTGAQYITATEGFRIGGDNRVGNSLHFKGAIYSVNLFADVRTAQEIAQDVIAVTPDADALLYSTCFAVLRNKKVYTELDGRAFSATAPMVLDSNLPEAPKTIQATIRIPTDYHGRGGVILGNYGGSDSNQFNLELYTFGRIRFFMVANGRSYEHIFSTDVRSNDPTHIAVTMDGQLITLYVNGAAKESTRLAVGFPAITENIVIGGDHRAGNIWYFRGLIYAVHMFSDVRTPAEIRADAVSVEEDADSLMYNRYFKAAECPSNTDNGKHVESDWIIDCHPAEAEKGLMHKECDLCGKVLLVSDIGRDIVGDRAVDYANADGLAFLSENDTYKLDQALTGAPKTIEVSFNLPKSYKLRAGVLFGNYTAGDKDQINLEIYTNGQPRLWFKTNKVSYTCQFTTDVRADGMQHIAVTVEGLSAKLYVGGVLAETIALEKELPGVTNGYCIGGDNRVGNAQYFKGTIYAVNLFDDVRTSEEIAHDAVLVTSDADGLLYSKYFTE